MARNRHKPAGCFHRPPPPFHADFSQSLDKQGLGISSVPPFLVEGRRFVNAEAAAATHFSAIMVVGVRTPIGDRPSAVSRQAVMKFI